MDDFILEKKIRETLEHRAEHAGHVFAEQRIRAKIYQELKLEEAEPMKKRNWKKTAVMAAAICVLGSMTAVALGKTVSITGSSSRENRITSYAEAEEKQESLDDDVKMLEKFSNGYAFKEAVPMEETGTDKDGNVTAKETSLNIVYSKDGAEDIYAHSSRLNLGITENPDAVRTLEDGTELVYTNIVNKFVPNGYEITEEEKKLQEDGKLNIGFKGEGGEIEIRKSSHVMWVQDEILYSLMIFDDMEADEMLNMAQELAESK